MGGGAGEGTSLFLGGSGSDGTHRQSLTSGGEPKGLGEGGPWIHGSQEGQLPQRKGGARGEKKEGSLNFMTYNVRGLNAPIKRNNVIREIKHYKVDVVLLQETRI